MPPVKRQGFGPVSYTHLDVYKRQEGYKAIEKAYKEGKVKAIGLSNFPDELLQEAIDTMEIKPQVVHCLLYTSFFRRVIHRPPTPRQAARCREQKTV